MQNLLLSKILWNSILILNFFKLITNTLLHERQVRISNTKVVTKLKVILLNKEFVFVEVGKNTQAIDVCEHLVEQLKLNFSKDKRLFLIQRQRIIKVLDDNEYILKVIENYEGAKDIATK